MSTFTSPNLRITGPLPRRDILAVCAFLNRGRCTGNAGAATEGAEILLDRLAAAARMQ
jgi:hypothetical protein